MSVVLEAAFVLVFLVVPWSCLLLFLYDEKRERNKGIMTLLQISDSVHCRPAGFVDGDSFGCRIAFATGRRQTGRTGLILQLRRASASIQSPI